SSSAADRSERAGPGVDRGGNDGDLRPARSSETRRRRTELTTGSRRGRTDGVRAMADLKNLKGVSEKDRAMIAEAENLLGPEPSEMGFVKNLFWGRIREDLVFPYPDIAETSPEETAECDRLLAELEDYLRNEHPAVLIDQEQHLPEWVIRRLFDLGVLGLTIPKEHGGLGMGITSYNRVLELIGKYCGST